MFIWGKLYGGRRGVHMGKKGRGDVEVIGLIIWGVIWQHTVRVTCGNNYWWTHCMTLALVSVFMYVMH